MSKFKYIKTLLLLLVFLTGAASCQKDNIVTIDSADETDTDINNIVFTRHVTVTFTSDGNAVVSGTNDDFTVTVEGNQVTLSYTGDEHVMYELTGTAENGCFKLFSGKKQGVTLNGLNLTNASGYAINLQAGRTFVVLSDSNRLSGGLFSEGSLIFSGSGSLCVTNTGEGIEAKGTMTINSGEIYSYSSTDDAINSGGDFTISGGYVYGQSAGNDGLDANGNCYIKGGVVYAIGARSPEVAIDANTEGGFKLYVEGGTIIAIGGLENNASLTQNCYQASSWSQNTWYALTIDSMVYAFKTPASGGTPLVVSGASSPTLSSNITVNDGTIRFESLFYENATISGGTEVSLSSYTGGSGGEPGGGGNPGGPGGGPH